MFNRQKYLNDSLFEAVKDQNLKKIDALISQGAQINAMNELHKTPLHKAIWYNFKNLALIECLIQNNADLEARDGKGKTPLEAHNEQFADAERSQQINIKELEDKMQRFDQKNHYSFFGYSQEKLKLDLQEKIDAMKSELALMQGNHQKIVTLLMPEKHEQLIYNAAS